MVCKEDVVLWFKESESYKRIDTMCTLLNMCLPFELRFLGTCLEELGTRDSKELRGIELRVNNSTELAAEMAACQHGEPSDIKVRRKMVLYLALIRACNRPCVNELFNTLHSWSNNDFLKTAEGDALQELLLVYTMAANHPVFSFEQRMKCGEIYNQIRYGRAEYSFTDIPENAIETSADLPTLSHPLTSTAHLISPVPPEMTTSMQNIVLMPAKHEQLIGVGAPVHATPSNQAANIVTQIYEPNVGSQILHRDMVSISPHHVYVENVQQPPPAPQPIYQHNVNFAPQSHVCPNPSTSNNPMPPYSTHQQQRQNLVHHVPHQRYPAHLSDHSESPSQPSSPIGSRSSSPKVNLPQQSSRHNVHKVESRSSSFDATSTQSQHQPSYIEYDKNESPPVQQHTNKLNENAVDDGLNQMQAMYYNNRNGYLRDMRVRGNSRHSVVKPNVMHQMGQPPPQQQQQQGPLQPPPPPTTTNPNGLAYTMQNMTLMDGTSNTVILNSEGVPMIPVMQKSESDSISSGESTENTTPPDTPLTTHNVHTSTSTRSRDQPSMMTRQKVQMTVSSAPSPGSLPHELLGDSSVPIATPNDNRTESHSTERKTYAKQHQSAQTPINLSGVSNAIVNNNLVTSTVLMTNKGSTTAIPGFSIAGNPPVLFQQYATQPPPQPPQHHIQPGIPQTQLNTAYHYQHLPLNNRASILTTPITTTSGPQTTTYRMPPYHMQPNGEVLYPFPSTIAYMQPTALSLQHSQKYQTNNSPLANVSPALVNVSTAQTQPVVMSKLPPPSLTAPYPAAILAAPDTKAGVSCFNCGSHSHTGRECQEASMEDVTRGTIYKLDYNTTIVGDGKTSDLIDNGSKIESPDTNTSSIPSAILK